MFSRVDDAPFVTQLHVQVAAGHPPSDGGALFHRLAYFGVSLFQEAHNELPPFAAIHHQV